MIFIENEATDHSITDHFLKIKVPTDKKIKSQPIKKKTYARRITLFPANRVENQNETKRRLAAPFGFVLVFNSAYGNGRH